MKLNDLFKVIDRVMVDRQDRLMALKTLRMMIEYRDRSVPNSISVDVARTMVDSLKRKIALFDRECVGYVDRVLALAQQHAPMPAEHALLINAVGFNKIVVDFGNGKQVTLTNI